MKLTSVKRRLRQTARRLKERPAVALVIRISGELEREHAGDMAGSIAYYTFLSFFPLLLGIIALLGLFLPSETVQGQVFQFVEQYAPGSRQFVERNITAIIDRRGTLGLISIIGLFWTGSAVVAAMSRVINHAWGISRCRPFYIRKIHDLAVALGTSLLLLLSMAITTLASVASGISLPVVGSLAGLLGRMVGFALIFFMVLLIYKFMPNTKTSWRFIWPGALLATVLFEVARSAFTIYLVKFASYDIVYGSVAATIALLVWIYVSAFSIIIGAEFASEYGKMRRGKETADFTSV